MKNKFIFTIIFILFVLILCGAASAANITVTPETGIQNAINTASNGDTISLAAGTYNEHDITVDKSLTITGPKTTGNDPPTAVVDAQEQGRAFNIAEGVTVTLQYLLIQNGDTSSETDSPSGGGIYNKGTLNVENSAIQNNYARGGSGGGIYNDPSGTVTLSDSNILFNNAMNGYGGGFSNDGTLNLNNSNVFSNNATYSGGAIYNDGTVTLTDSNVYINNAPYGGGGIYNYFSGTVTLTDSNVYSNTVNTYYGGGGIYNAGTLNLDSSNLYSNTATYCGGGGIYNYFSGTMTLTDSNVYSNTANYGGGIDNDGTTTINESNIYDNTASVGGGIYNNNDLSLTFCRIIGNSAGQGSDIYSAGDTVNAQYNWWGSNSDPSGKISGDVNFTPWLISNVIANVVFSQTVNSPVNVGDRVNYIIKALNNGPDTATNININDIIPAGLTGVVVTPSIGTSYLGGVWIIPSLANLASATLTISGIATASMAGTTTTNSATATWNEFPSTVAIPDATTYTNKADVALSQSGNYSGNKVTFIITATNNGPDNASNIVIKDAIPAGLTNVTVTPSVGTYSNGVWTIPSLIDLGTATLNITGTAIPRSTITNNGTQISQTEYNSQLANISANVYVPAVDIAVDNEPIQYYPDTGTYEDYYDVHNNPVMLVTAINNGPDDATGVKLEFDIGNSFAYMGLDTRGHGTAVYNSNNNTITWTPGTIPYNTGASLVVYLKVIASGDKTPNQTTTCSLTNVDQIDTNPTNNQSNFGINTDPSPDIGVNQTYNTFTNNGKTYVTYTITINNNGPDNATGLQIKDKLPTGLTYISNQLSNDNGTTWNNNTASYNPTTGIWNIGNYNNNDQTKILNITAQITTTTGTIKNYATVRTLDQFDWNWPNDEQETILNISGTYAPKADIAVDNEPIQYYPDTGTYEDYYDVHNNPVMLVTAINNGPDDATGVKLEFDIGNSFAYMGLDTRGHGTAVYNSNNNTITWTPGTIPYNTGASLVVYLKVIASGDKTPNQTTTCSLTNVDQIDTNPTNNQSNFGINTDPSPDIGVNQTYNTFTNNGKTYVTYTITINNNGPDNATGLQIKDKLPTGLTYISNQLSNDNGTTWNNNTASYNPTTGIWNIGNYNNNDQTKILNITAQITTTTGTIKNYATVYSLDQFDWNWPNDEQETILNQ